MQQPPPPPPYGSRQYPAPPPTPGPWQQPPPQAYPPHQYPPYYPPPQAGQPWQQPPMPSPPRRGKLPRWVWIVGVIFCLMIIGSAMNALHPTQQAAQPTSGPTTAPTVASQPTSKPTNPDLFTTALLGADLQYFEATYGKAKPLDVGYQFPNHLLVVPSLLPAPYNTRIDSIVVLPDSGQYWSQEQGKQQCSTFMPKDAKRQKDYPLKNSSGTTLSVKQVYESASLAKQFPAEEFRSFKQATPPGSFALQLDYNPDNGLVRACSVHINLELD